MKKIINRVDDIVSEMSSGLISAHPLLEWIPQYAIISRKERRVDKVALISGGGSGHEPAHAGFVGEGMLDAAVCGDIFASPSQVQVYKAIRLFADSKGVLLIVKNYSGDVMNFGNAADMAREDGQKVEVVHVADDIALEDSLYTVGRRGVAGTVLVHKIAGAAAEKGWELDEVKRVAQKTAQNVRSLGLALTSCTVPAKGTPTFHLSEAEIEYGVGIHGEPGIRKERMQTASELVDRMVSSLLEELQYPHEIVVLVNGFGATPLQELYIVNYEISKRLWERGIKIPRAFVGNYMTSIDMAGFSISFLHPDEELLTLLSAFSSTPAFTVLGTSGPSMYTPVDSLSCEAAVIKPIVNGTPVLENEDCLSLNNIIFLVWKMGEVIIENEVSFCELDSHAGDGDFGASIAKGFRQLAIRMPEILREESSSVGQFLEACSMVLMEHCGGASGPIWGSAFRAAGRYAGNADRMSVADFANLLDAALTGIQKTGERSFGRGAVVGDKTLVDALSPCVEKWKECSSQGNGVLQAMKEGAKAAIDGAEATKELVARMGRAGTVGQRSLGYPDAGAYALGIIFTRLAESLEG